MRVGEVIRHSISELLGRREIHDDALERSIVTIPEVRMSNDLRIATVYVMPLGGANGRSGRIKFSKEVVVSVREAEAVPAAAAPKP